MRYFFVILFSLILLSPAVVKAAPENIVDFNGRTEIYSFETDNDNSVVFEPQSCNEFQSIKIIFNEPTNGEIIFYKEVTEQVDQNQVYSGCRFELRDGALVDQILDLDVAVRNSWLESNNITSEQLELYSVDGENINIYDLNQSQSESELFKVAQASGVTGSEFGVFSSAIISQSTIINSGIQLLALCVISLAIFILVLFFLSSVSSSQSFKYRVEGA